jgi:hypothetical protein
MEKIIYYLLILINKKIPDWIVRDFRTRKQDFYTIFMILLTLWMIFLES